MQEKRRGPSSHWPHGGILGGSPSKQLFLSPAPEPLSPLLFLWDVFDMLLMSVGSCVLLNCAEWLSGPGPISSIILLCGMQPVSHCPSLPSCRNLGAGLQCRMGDNPLIAEAQLQKDDKAKSLYVLSYACQQSLNVLLTRVCQLCPFKLRKNKNLRLE